MINYLGGNTKNQNTSYKDNSDEKIFIPSYAENLRISTVEIVSAIVEFTAICLPF